MNSIPDNRPEAQDSVTTDPPDRALVNSWVLVSDFGSTLSALSARFGEIPQDADAGIGYVYIDHDAGISLKIECIGTKTGDNLSKTSMISLENMVSLRLRYSSLKLLNLTLLSQEQIQRFGLPAIPEWSRFYDTPELRTTRELEWLDPFRAKGFFDDVMTILPGKGEDVPELIWVRLMQYDRDTDRFLGTLLNEPFRDYGIHRNDRIEIQTVRKPSGISLVAVPRKVSREKGTTSNIPYNLKESGGVQ